MDINVKITGRNLELTSSLKETINKRAKRLERYISNSTSLDVLVVLSVEKERQKVEVTIPIKDTIIRAEQITQDMYASIDVAFSIIERQIVKYKDKLVSKKQTKEMFDNSFLEETTLDESEVIVNKVKRFSPNVMSVEEACVEMDLIGHGFFVFRNIDTNDFSIVYKRNDGTYGLIILD